MKNYGEMKIGELLMETIFSKYEDASEKIKQAAKVTVKAIRDLSLFSIVVFLISWAIISVGIANNSKHLIILGCIAKALSSVTLLTIALPLGIIIGGRGYFYFIRSFFIYQIFIALIIMIAPDFADFSKLGILLFANFFFSFINIWAGSMPFVQIVVAIILAGTTFSFFLPNTFNLLSNQMYIIDINSSRAERVSYSISEIENGTAMFFLPDGRPNLLYRILDDHPSQRIILYKNPGSKKPVYSEDGELLKPITKEIVKAVIDEAKKAEKAKRAAETKATIDAVEAQRREQEAQKRAQAEVAAKQKAILEAATQRQAQLELDAKLQSQIPKSNKRDLEQDRATRRQAQQELDAKLQSQIPKSNKRDLEQDRRSFQGMIDKADSTSRWLPSSSIVNYVKGKHILVLLSSYTHEQGAEIIARLKSSGALVNYSLYSETTTSCPKSEICYSPRYLETTQAIQGSLSELCQFRITSSSTFGDTIIVGVGG